MKKQILITLVLVVLLSIILVGCAKAEPKSTPQPTTNPVPSISGGLSPAPPQPPIPSSTEGNNDSTSSSTLQSGLPLKVNEPVDAATLTTATIMVKGQTQPGATLNINDQIGTADGQGNFSIPLILDEGLNAIDVIASDSDSINQGEVLLMVDVDLSQASSSSLSSVSSSDTVYSFQNDVLLKILSPQDGADINTDTVTVTGQTEPGAAVCVNDQVSMADSSGKFSIPVDLSAGLNAIDVVSLDDSGNQNEVLLMVNGGSGS